MFDKKTLLYLTRGKIIVSSSAKEKRKLYQIDWDGNDPTPAFKSIKKNLRANSAIVILGHDLSYVLTVQIPQAKINRSLVQSTVQPLVPENITIDNFDWKIIGENAAKKLALVQVIATPGGILNNLSYAAKVNKIKIESITPISILLASQTNSLKNPHLIIWAGQEKLAVVSHHGNVYLSENIENDAQTMVNDLIEFSLEKHGLKINNVVMDWVVDKKIEFPSQWKVNKGSLDPMAAAAAKKPKKGKDEETLELKPVEEPTEPQEKSEVSKVEPAQTTGEVATAKESSAEATETPIDSTETNEAESEEPTKEEEKDSESDEEEEEEAKPRVNKKILIILLAVLVVGGLVVGGVLYFRSRVQKSSSSTEPTSQEPTPTPTTVPEGVSLEDYKAQVLNGSGIAGEAGVVQGLLATAGLEEVDTGNAASYDFTDTKVSLKKDVPDEVFDEIKKALESYSVVKGDTLSEDSGFDIVVTVGSTKTEVETTPTPTSASSPTPTP